MPDLKKKDKYKEKGFDGEAVKAKIVPLSFREARRLHMPLYAALVSELLEEGCTVAACHMKRLIEKEVLLYETRQVLRVVSDEPDFLLELLENVKLAEQSCRLCGLSGVLSAVKLLYQATFMVEKYDRHFPWLLEEIYDILASVILPMRTNKLSSVKEYVSRFSFKYGRYLIKQGKNINTAIKVLADGAELCKGESWAPDTIAEQYIYMTLHEAIALKLAAIYLDYAKRLDLKEALDMVDKATYCYAQVGEKKQKLQIARATCIKIDLLIDKRNYSAALKEIDNVQYNIRKDMSVAFDKIRCELYMQQGLCFYNQLMNAGAMKSFTASYNIARKHNFGSLEAELLLNIGKARASSREHHLKAFAAFVESKRIFNVGHDEQNRKKINYLLAKLKADQIFPELLSLIRSKDFCSLYNLRAWKNQCKPFWDINLEMSMHALENRSSLTKAQMIELILRDDSDKKYFAALGSEYATFLYDKEDGEESIDEKVSSDGVETSSSFFREMPGVLKNKTMGLSKDSDDSYEKYYEKMKNEALNCLVVEFGRSGIREVAKKEG